MRTYDNLLEITHSFLLSVELYKSSWFFKIFFNALFYYSGYALLFLFYRRVKITSNLFLAILSRFPPYLGGGGGGGSHNAQKDENIKIYAFC